MSKKLLSMRDSMDLHAKLDMNITLFRKSVLENKLDFNSLTIALASINELLWDHHRRFYFIGKDSDKKKDL